MNLKNFINRGIEKTGNQKVLGDLLGVSPQQLTNANGGRAGLPVAACCILAEIIGEDERVIVAASELITEKKPERVAYWKKKLIEFEKLAACILVGVILNVSPTPSQAAPMLQVTNLTLYIMLNIARAHPGQPIPLTIRSPVMLC